MKSTTLYAVCLYYVCDMFGKSTQIHFYAICFNVKSIPYSANIFVYLKHQWKIAKRKIEVTRRVCTSNSLYIYVQTGSSSSSHMIPYRKVSPLYFSTYRPPGVFFAFLKTPSSLQFFHISICCWFFFLGCCCLRLRFFSHST